MTSRNYPIHLSAQPWSVGQSRQRLRRNVKSIGIKISLLPKKFNDVLQQLQYKQNYNQLSSFLVLESSSSNLILALYTLACRYLDPPFSLLLIECKYSKLFSIFSSQYGSCRFKIWAASPTEIPDRIVALFVSASSAASDLVWCWIFRHACWVSTYSSLKALPTALPIAKAEAVTISAMIRCHINQKHLK